MSLHGWSTCCPWFTYLAYDQSSYTALALTMTLTMTLSSTLTITLHVAQVSSTTGTKIRDGMWHHVMSTHGSSDSRVYVDGVLAYISGAQTSDNFYKVLY